MSRRLFLPGEQGSSGAAVQLAVYRNYLNLLKKKSMILKKQIEILLS